MSKNLLTRIAVAAVAIPIILTICYTGGYWYFGMIALFAIAAATEFLLNEGYRLRQPVFWLFLLFILMCLDISAVSFGQGDLGDFARPFEGAHSLMHHLAALMVGFFLFSAMVAAVGKSAPDELFRKQSRLFFGVFYVGCLYSFVLAIGMEPKLENVFGPSAHGNFLLFLFGLLWVGDTCAMGFGKWLGKHKLAPAVSPNKTVEGFIGGIIGAVAVGVLMYFWKFSHLGFIHTMASAVGCSIFGQLGDLVESLWKRSLGIKDSSTIIPGHGGVLDRFDSLLFAAPFMYAYLIVFVPPNL